MRASIFVSAAAFAVASAQSSSPTSSVDAFPQTTYLTQTNSLGVVTGMPAVDSSIAQQPNAVTDQPAVVTSQPVPADIPAVGPGVHTLLLPGTGTGSMVNQTRTVTVSANNSTTLMVAPATTSGSGASGSGSGSSNPTGSDASGSGATRTGSSTSRPSSTTGAASNVKVAAGSLVGFGAFVAAFL